jgi:hypothetical protein
MFTYFGRTPLKSLNTDIRIWYAVFFFPLSLPKLLPDLIYVDMINTRVSYNKQELLTLRLIINRNYLPVVL